MPNVERVIENAWDYKLNQRKLVTKMMNLMQMKQISHTCSDQVYHAQFPQRFKLMEIILLLKLEKIQHYIHFLTGYNNLYIKLIKT